MTSFELEAVTMSGVKFDGLVQKVVVRTTEGDICILGSHTDFASPLGCGKAKIITDDGREINAFAEGGFISVQGDKTRIIATKFEIE